MDDRTAGAAVRVVYVISCYPAVSHSFIQREISALRKLGIDVQPVALRKSRVADIRTEADRLDLARTYAVLPAGPGRLIKAHLKAFLAGPARYLSSAVFAIHGATSLTELARRLGHFAQAALVWQYCACLGIRHLHAHFERPSADVAMLAAKLGGDRDAGWLWSFTAHNPTQYLRATDRLARKTTHAQFVVCVSDFGRNQLMELVQHECWSRLHVVRCGVDPATFRRKGPPADPPLVLTVARLVPLKGHALLLEALSIVRRHGVSFRAAWVGDGPERPHLQRLADQMDLSSMIDMVGDVGQDVIHEWYQKAQVFCLSSFLEGIPVVLMEAMAMELPVIAPRISGIPELVEDGVTGRLVTPGSPTQLADAIMQILAESPARRAAMGAAGRERVAAEFTCDASAERLRDLFITAGASRP